MIKCNKGVVEAEGSGAELFSDWATITEVLYKHCVKYGIPRNDVNAQFTRLLFEAVAVAGSQLDKEGNDDTDRQR